MGLICHYTKLPYGIASAPSIFQAAMEAMLQGIDGCLVYLDDILVCGSTDQEHLQRLDKVLEHLEAHDLRVNQSVPIQEEMMSSEQTDENIKLAISESSKNL